MSAANTITVVGNLTSEPELRFTTTGLPVCNMRIAVNEVSVVNGERRERTEYFQIVTWRSLAENIAASLSTGNRVQVTGRLSIRQANVNGEDRYYTEITADEVGLSLRWQRVDPEMIEKHNGKTDDRQLVGAGAAGGANESGPLYGDEEPF